jgi:hypothetical protein
MCNRYEKGRPMGNLVVFRRDDSPVPRGVTGKRYTVPSESQNWPRAVPIGFSQSVRSGKPASWALPGVFTRHRLTRFSRDAANTETHVDPDAYLLVLLADQERTAGRDEQAQSLLDAAYAAFDRNAVDQPDRMSNQR